jgi:hypothetical protein
MYMYEIITILYSSIRVLIDSRWSELLLYLPIVIIILIHCYVYVSC